MPSTIAIVMRAKNEMPHAGQALDALAKQEYRDFELHAVDSGSTDGTFEELEQNADRLVRIEPKDYLPGKVLNAAIRDTSSDIVVLLNADAIPLANDWLATLVQPILEGKADITFGKQVPRPDARFIVAYDYERAYDPTNMHPGFFSAVACAFRRTQWEHHPFPEEGYAEDAAWAKACQADGARIRFVPESVVEHSHNYTLQELYRKRYRQAHVIGPGSVIQCAKEIARDFIHAGRRLALHTIPYNVAYRITICLALRNGANSK